LIFKNIEDKTVVWFSKNNQYIVLESITATVLKKINDKINSEKIREFISLELPVPRKQSGEFLKELKEKFFNNDFNELEKSVNYSTVSIPEGLNFRKFYKINSIVFKVEFSSEFELSLIHPKFAHIEINKIKHQHSFVVFSKNNKTSLLY